VGDLRGLQAPAIWAPVFWVHVNTRAEWAECWRDDKNPSWPPKQTCIARRVQAKPYNQRREPLVSQVILFVRRGGTSIGDISCPGVGPAMHRARRARGARAVLGCPGSHPATKKTRTSCDRRGDPQSHHTIGRGGRFPPEACLPPGLHNCRPPPFPPQPPRSWRAIGVRQGEWKYICSLGLRMMIGNLKRYRLCEPRKQHSSTHSPLPEHRTGSL
jgi:hypothetical protein